MTWEQSLYQHLAADSNLNMLGGRIFWDVAKFTSGQGQTVPYLVIQQVSSNESTSWDGGSGGSFPLVQFTVWAKARNTANTIRRLLRTSIEGQDIGVASVTISGIQDHTDDGVQPILFGAILETRFHISDKQ